MSDPITITIKRLLPSQNLWVNKRGMMGSLVYKRERDVWYCLLRAALRPKVAPEHLVRVRIISFRSQLLDFGNLVGGAKAIPDGLTILGYLKDDKPKWFHCDYEQRKCPRASVCTIIHLINP